MSDFDTPKPDTSNSAMANSDKSGSDTAALDMPESDTTNPDKTQSQPSNPPSTWKLHHRIDNWMSERFVESAGCVLFHLSTQRICIIKSRQSGEYLLPKGRCNLGECRQDAALRETKEETGYSAYLLPLTMYTRAPPPVETASSGEDRPLLFEGICEPITMQLRHIGTGGIKVIWWFVAAVDEGIQPCQDSRDVEMYEPVMVGYSEALARLTWPKDREVVCRALDSVKHQTHLDDLSRITLDGASVHDEGVDETIE